MRSRLPLRRPHQDGFTLVELLVVVIIIGILAAIAIPRFLSQQEKGHDATAISDLRNLIAIETSLEATAGLTDDPAEIHAEGWAGSDPRVRVCADESAAGDDITITAWHLGGSTQYSYIRSSAVIESNEVTPQDTCAAQGVAGDLVWPYSP